MRRKNVKILLLVSIALILLGVAVYGAASFWKQKKITDIASFEDCVKAGYPVMESYPEQCRTPDGRNFTRELTNEEKARIVPPNENCKDLCGDGICQEYVCMAIGCPCAETKESCPQDCANNQGSENNNTSLANPASVYCVENGRRLEIRTDSNGGQTGYCIFSDGSECEEWTYYRGECPKE